MLQLGACGPAAGQGVLSRRCCLAPVPPRRSRRPMCGAASCCRRTWHPPRRAAPRDVPLPCRATRCWGYELSEYPARPHPHRASQWDMMGGKAPDFKPGQCSFFQGNYALSEALGWVIVVVSGRAARPRCFARDHPLAWRLWCTPARYTPVVCAPFASTPPRTLHDKPHCTPLPPSISTPGLWCAVHAAHLRRCVARLPLRRHQPHQ